jgi:CRISPR/Cas system-associated exonuclease Cas4 (RecB family)
MLDFDRLIEKHLEREHRPKTPGRYYPSEIGGCLRKVWYTYKCPVPTKIDMVKIFEVGNLMHDFIAEVMRSERNPEVELVDSELPFRIEVDGFTISGRIDDVLLVKESGKKMLVEVKSTKFVDYAKAASPSHAMQLQLYMHATGIHDGIVLYVEKSTLRTRAFPLAYDKAAADAAIGRFKQLHGLLAGNAIPEAEAKKSRDSAWQCKTCDYAERCAKE